MSQQLVIDGFAFAREGGALNGTLKVSDLVRLHDLLVEVAGEVRFQVHGSKGESGQPQLRLQVDGTLSLACQRCLGAIPFALDVDSLFELVPEGADLTQEELDDDSRDFLPVAGALDVAELVEDEILLTLPVVPRHEKCGLPSGAEAGKRLNPFAALSVLKGKPN